MATIRRPCARVAVAMCATLLLSCASEPTCAAPSDSGTRECHDLTFNNVEYDEWRTVDKPKITQELGDGRYPACNRGKCGLGGFGNTDVWLVEGVDPTVALMGLRENSHTPVIFVRVGVDPESIEPSIPPGLLD